MVGFVIVEASGGRLRATVERRLEVNHPSMAGNYKIVMHHYLDRHNADVLATIYDDNGKPFEMVEINKDGSFSYIEV